jgi:hypothetical protein
MTIGQNRHERAAEMTMSLLVSPRMTTWPGTATCIAGDQARGTLECNWLGPGAAARVGIEGSAFQPVSSRR